MLTAPRREDSVPSQFYLDLVQELFEVPTAAVMEYVIGRLCGQYGARYACVHLTDSYLQSAFPDCMHRCPPGHGSPADMQPLIASEESWLQFAGRMGRSVSLEEALSSAPHSALLCSYFQFTDGLSIPLLYQGESLGTLNLYLEAGTLSRADIQALSSLGGVIYGLVKRSKMLRVLQDRDDIINALARSVEAKDPYTGEHLERVRAYAVDLARALSLPEDEVQAIERAAFLHDIGKIGVPDSILTKTGSLNPDEWEAMKRHPLIAGEIFQGVRDPELMRSLPGILWHHERPDGSGYPHGLQGDAIPVMARVIAVADAYDALTSDRPYRKGLSPEAAAGILKAQAGKQFDREIVDRFLGAVANHEKRRAVG